jgi:PSP1 C-terminal conserved region
MRFPSHEHDELVGENIEVPDQHEDLPYYGLQNLRGHGHSLSLDAAMPYGAVPRQKIYAVKFKRSQRNFVLGSRVNRELKIGTYVKVEADRGEDLGIVVGRPDKSFIRDGPKRILRLATHDEVSLLALKREEEEELLSVCRQKAQQRGLPMNVVDAEYQFDRHKLTFFFEAEGRVDFRELVRDLFSMYKTRIWMQQLDKSTSMFAPAMVAPVMDGPLDFGNPIIAPLSEFVDSIYPNVQP